MTTATQKTVAEMTVSELLDANTRIGNRLDYADPKVVEGETVPEVRALLSRRREIRAELSRRHEETEAGPNFYDVFPSPEEAANF